MIRSKNVKFPSLDKLYYHSNDMKIPPTQHLLNPQTQMMLARNASNTPIQNQYNMGEAIYNLSRQNNNGMNVNQTRNSLFFQNYTNARQANVDHTQALRNVSRTNTMSCQVYPPLLCRYKGISNEFLPVMILPGGELHASQPNQRPDMVLNFHNVSGAITFTTCYIDANKLDLFKIVITTLYAMMSDTPLTVTSFTRLYDETRYTVLHKSS